MSDFPREFKRLGFTIHSGTPTQEELIALTRAIDLIGKSANPPKKYRSSWARLKIQNSLPRKWGNTPS
jgi:ribonuclease HII